MLATTDIQPNRKASRQSDDATEPAPSGAGSGQPVRLPYKRHGRFKPTIYWYTPFLIVGGAALLILLLYVVIRKVARAAEDKNWPDAERLRARRDSQPPSDAKRG